MRTVRPRVGPEPLFALAYLGTGVLETRGVFKVLRKGRLGAGASVYRVRGLNPAG